MILGLRALPVDTQRVGRREVTPSARLWLSGNATLLQQGQRSGYSALLPRNRRSAAAAKQGGMATTTAQDIPPLGEPTGMARLLSRPALFAAGVPLIAAICGLLTYAAVTGLVPYRPSHAGLFALILLNVVLVGTLGAIIAWRLMRLWSRRRSAGARLHFRLVGPVCRRSHRTSDSDRRVCCRHRQSGRRAMVFAGREECSRKCSECRATLRPGAAGGYCRRCI